MTANAQSPVYQSYRPDASTASPDGLGGVMDRVEDRVEALGHDAVQAIDGRRHAAAESLSSAAGSLHRSADKAADLGQKGGEKVSHLAHGAADTLQAGADFVREHDFKSMMQSVEGFVRRNPGQALLAAGVVGFFTARAMRND